MVDAYAAGTHQFRCDPGQPLAENELPHFRGLTPKIRDLQKCLAVRGSLLERYGIDRTLSHASIDADSIMFQQVGRENVLQLEVAVIAVKLDLLRGERERGIKLLLAVRGMIPGCDLGTVFKTARRNGPFLHLHNQSCRLKRFSKSILLPCCLCPERSRYSDGMGPARAANGRKLKAAEVHPTSAAEERGQLASRTRIQDVARLADVSLGTVSAVLNGKGRVAASTRDRVQGAIAELGYRPDLYASNLARRQTQVLGVLVSNLQNPFFAETAQAIEEEAMRHGFQVSLMASNFSPEQHRIAVQQLLGARIAGLAVMTSEHDELSGRLIAASGVPTVFLDGGNPKGNSRIIRVDSRGGMKAAVSHLLELGHRDLLFVRNSRAATTGEKPVGALLSHKLRNQGFQSAVRAYATTDLRTTVIDVHGAAADAGELAIASVFGKTHFTAVIAVTDMVAMGVYRGLQARGARIPQDISVVGFDNTYFSRFLNPPLSTVDVSRAHLSKMAVQALLNKAADAPLLIHLKTNLVLRESTAPPPALRGT